MAIAGQDEPDKPGAQAADPVEKQEMPAFGAGGHLRFGGKHV